MMKNSIKTFRFILLAALFISSGLSEIYKDRLLIYIDNSFHNQVIETGSNYTTDLLFNDFLRAQGIVSINNWIPNARPTDRDGDIYINRYFVVHFDPAEKSIDSMIEKLEDYKPIKYAEPLAINKALYTPNDPYLGTQYALELIDAELAYDLWDIDEGEIPGFSPNREIVVGIADAGLEWDHPDLIDNVWQNLGEDVDGDGMVVVQTGNSWSFDSGDINGIDDDGDGYVDNFVGWDVGFDDNDPAPYNNNYDHGTMVAGCVSSSTNNNLGIASIGWSVKLMGVNSSDENPQYISDGYAGILTAAQMGADVINCSWGGGSGGGGAQSIINTAFNTYNSIVVASAGNGDGGTVFESHYPSGFENVVSVTAIGPNDNFGCWAHAGTTIDLCAPGESVRTTNVNGGYSYVNGTSFSSPITAGAIALLWSRFPEAEKEWVIDRIISNTDQFSDMQSSCNAGSLVGMLGSGRLNVYKALSSGAYPSLYVSNLNFLNDSDGDGVLSPGEQISIKVIVGNQEGWSDATGVTLTLTTNDDRLTILDDTIEFSSVIYPGTTTFTLLDQFTIEASIDAQLGTIPCIIELQSSIDDGSTYSITEEIEIELSIDQNGFSHPNPGMVMKSSPVIADLYGNSFGEIIVGSDDNKVHGFLSSGDSLYNFPLSTSGRVRSSPAIGDVDNDGSQELVFSSYFGMVYVYSFFGSPELAHEVDGYISGSVALHDVDEDGDMEIFFTTMINDSSGKIHAIHHDGNSLDGFPIDSEKMLVGPSIADIDLDGSVDIVTCTWDHNVNAHDINGDLKSGFPFHSSHRFNIPATLANIDSDPEVEIIVGNDAGLLHVLNYDGGELSRFQVSDDIRGGISVADLNDDGSYEVLFTGYHDSLFVWNPQTGNMLEGWPKDLGSNSLSEPLTADLDNDGDLEVIAIKKSGVLFLYEHDGTPHGISELILSGNVESTPVLYDIDNDGDFEIAVGTTSGLKVVDLKTNKGDRASWRMHRGNKYRTGFYETSTLLTTENNVITPDRFLISDNFPNPFNPSTNITITLPENEYVKLVVHDLVGNEVKVLIDDFVGAGQKRIVYDGTNNSGNEISGGIYFYTLSFKDQRVTKKMVFLK